jgi:hypothetical protein
MAAVDTAVVVAADVEAAVAAEVVVVVAAVATAAATAAATAKPVSYSLQSGGASAPRLSTFPLSRRNRKCRFCID